MSQENERTWRGVRYRVSPRGESDSRRRPLDEHLYARFPAAYRLLAARVSRLPPRSRIRRMMLALRIRRVQAAFNRRDFDLIAMGWEPGVEYRPAADLTPPDEDRVVYGHDGYLERMRLWLDVFGDLRFEPEEVVDLGDRLLVTVRWSGHGSGSGVPMSGRLFQVITPRRGLVQRQKDFSDRTEALEAAELRE